MPPMAITLKMLKSNFPAEPANSIPKAIPLFSVKWIMNQSGKITNSCPRYMFVLIQILRTWSKSSTKKTSKKGLK